MNSANIGRVCILAVGEELLRGEIIETNAAHIIRVLTDAGYDVDETRTVGDRPADIQAAVLDLTARAGILIITGGLGPTEDDLTRQAVADAFGRAMEYQDNVLDWMAQRIGRPVSELAKSNRRQCERIAGSELIRNAYGTAPATWLNLPSGGMIALLPGVPVEMKGLLADEILPRLLKSHPPYRSTAVAYFSCAGAGESTMADSVKDLSGEPGITIGTRISDSVIAFRIVADGLTLDAARARLAEILPQVRERLKAWIYAEGDLPPIVALHKILFERGWTITVSESCTGGLLAAELTSLAGATAFFKESHVLYANEAKTKYAGVDPELIKRYGAVSKEVVEAIAVHSLKNANADIAIAVSGIAGPTGGSPEKPVGTVDVAVAFKDRVVSERRRMYGDRTAVRRRAVQSALVLALRTISSPQADL